MVATLLVMIATEKSEEDRIQSVGERVELGRLLSGMIYSHWPHKPVPGGDATATLRFTTIHTLPQARGAILALNHIFLPHSSP